MRAARITFSTTPDQVAGPYGAAPPGTANPPRQDSNLTPWSYAIDSPHILATNRGAYFNQIAVSGRRCTRRLRGRNDLSVQLNVRHAFNMTRGRTANRSLTDIDGDRFTPKTSIPCCCTIVILPGLNSLLVQGYFYDSNIANCDQVSTHLSQVTGSHPAATELSMYKHHFDPGPT